MTKYSHTLKCCLMAWTCRWSGRCAAHYCDVIMDVVAPQITSLTIVYSAVYSGADQRKHQSPVSLAFVRGIHRWIPPHKWPVTRKMFPFDDVIMLHPCAIISVQIEILFKELILLTAHCKIIVNKHMNNTKAILITSNLTNQSLALVQHSGHASDEYKQSLTNENGKAVPIIKFKQR